MTENQSSIKSFMENYFSKFSLLDSCLGSYNKISEELLNIIQKFDLKYQLQNSALEEHKDEQINIHLELSNPEIIKPGDIPELPKTSIEAITKRKDFMCRYIFDTAFILELKTNKKHEQKQESFIQTKLQTLGIKEFTPENQSKLLEKYFKESQDIFKNEDEVEIKGGKLSFDLPVLTMSNLDPASKMTPREKYELGLDVSEVGGDIVLAGIPYLIQNEFSYPNNMPIVAKSTLKGQEVRVDYLYQADPVFGNNYASIFLLIQDQIKKDKDAGNEQGSQLDMVLNFKQKHDINFNPTDNYIPISLLFKAYGCPNDEKLLNYCNPQNDQATALFFIELFQEGQEHKKYMGLKRNFSQYEALLQIGKIISKNQKCENYTDVFRMVETAIYGLSKYIYTLKIEDIGKESPYCQTLGEICNRIYIASIDKKFLTDRDAIYNKRVVNIGQEIVGELREKMGGTFKQSLKDLITSIQSHSFYEIKQNPDSIKSILDNIINQYSNLITKSIKKSFTSSQDSKNKIIKNLNEQKTAYLSISQRREIIIRATGNAKINNEQRKVQRSFFGFICYITTPESGANVGCYLSPTIYSHITVPMVADDIQKYIFDHKLFQKEKTKTSVMAVKINYSTIGFVNWGKDFSTFYDDLIDWRTKHSLKKDYKKSDRLINVADQLFISIYYNIENNEINILTDGQRLMIPLFKKKVDEKDDVYEMIESGDLIYVCPAMIQNFTCAEYTDFGKDKRIKWCLAPSEALGIMPGVSPFQNHNKSVRSALSGAQMKSAQSQVISNYNNYYLKNLLINNENLKDTMYTPFNEVTFSYSPTTQLVYLIQMPFKDNQEDAMVISQDFIDRYGFATTSFKTYTDQCQGQTEQFQLPTVAKRGYNYSKIDQQVFEITTLGTKIDLNDVLIAKIKIFSRDDRQEKVDASTIYDSTQVGEYTCVSNVNNYTFDNDAQKVTNLKMVRTAFGRKPSIGDKVTSRNAQKSTIGRIIPGWCMPITDEGIIPNLIQDTNPIMRRETYGQELEMLISRLMDKKGILRMQISQDQFITNLIPDIKELTYDKIYKPCSSELFLNPNIVCGTYNYTVQKHIVDEKIRVRGDDGPIDPISKQSSAGKKNGGGLRIGDMERHAMSASGICHSLIDFFGRLSSNIPMQYCKKCGCCNIYYNWNEQQYYCQNCGPLLDNQYIQFGLNYSPKFLAHIMNSCAIQERLIVGGNDNTK